MPQPAGSASDRYYKKKDYTERSVETVQANFASGLIDEYLAEQSIRTAKAPIVLNAALS
jgi:hypothetical protein